MRNYFVALILALALVGWAVPVRADQAGQQARLKATLAQAEAYLAADQKLPDTNPNKNDYLMADNLRISFLKNKIVPTHPIGSGVATYNVSIDDDYKALCEERKRSDSSIQCLTPPTKQEEDLSGIDAGDLDKIKDGSIKAIKDKNKAQQDAIKEYNRKVKEAGDNYKREADRFYGPDKEALDKARERYIGSGAKTRLDTCTGATASSCGTTYLRYDSRGQPYYNEGAFNADSWTKTRYDTAMATRLETGRRMNEYKRQMNATPPML